MSRESLVSDHEQKSNLLFNRNLTIDVNGFIAGIRKEEVRYLKYRKYLDALCVYFWATTPVMISTLTFTVYIYRGGELSAAVVSIKNFQLR